MLPINDRDFLRLVEFVQQNYGINLSKKRQLISSRLSSTVLSMGYSGFTEYIDDILSNKQHANIETMLNKLTTNYTYFMREPAHFDFFKNTILPYLVHTKRNKTLNIWSAGCSTGQEPYTLSIIIKEFLGAQASAWDARVLATDISQKALSIAKAGIYDVESIKDVPEKWKTTYFAPVPNSDQCTLVPQIKSNVIFRTFNLMDPIQFKVKFDVIFCRNVMIYFDQPTKDALIQRFYHATNPGGYLLIGHSE
ncbi:MAG: protein-glutamate O-methyltransferase CheR, partial [Epulopiscium sp.]|nr:protein-glutamate O-methyltransferase CheR [Candidatus Epulonipiscium sp.]